MCEHIHISVNYNIKMDGLLIIEKASAQILCLHILDILHDSVIKYLVN